MNASALILGQSQRDALRQLREHAAAEPVDVRAVLELCKSAEGRAAHLERMKAFSVPIPTAFMVTFSIETGQPAGLCRHMSMSSLRHGRAPTPDAVWMICEELGFAGALDHCTVWPEDIGQGDKAINVVQPIAVTSVKAR
jgi:hypothetical protein